MLHEQTNISLSDISSNTELESQKFSGLNHKINTNQMKGLQFYQQQMDQKKQEQLIKKMVLKQSISGSLSTPNLQREA